MDTQHVQDYMSHELVTCTESATLSDVQGLLEARRVTRVLVVDSVGVPVGIISEKDVMGFLLKDKSMRGLEEMRAREAMCSGLITIKPSASIAQAAEVMITRNIGSLVVEEDDLQGILTKADVVNCFGDMGSSRYSVGQFMTTHPITVEPSQSIFSTIELMLQNRISRVIVVNQDGVPEGMITFADFVLTSAFPLINLSKKLFVGEGQPPAADFLKRANAMGLLVRDFMTQHPLSVSQDSSLSEAARIMTKNGFSGLPVTNNPLRLTGILSKPDIAQAVAYERKTDSPGHQSLNTLRSSKLLRRGKGQVPTNVASAEC